jgi:hypothetical protein
VYKKEEVYNMNTESFLSTNKNQLLSLFGQIYSGRSLELLISPGKVSSEDFTKSCCLDAIYFFRRNGEDLDFPITKNRPPTDLDKTLAEELYIITLCEDGVKRGNLKRIGQRYSLVDGRDYKNVNCSKKYIISSLE